MSAEQLKAQKEQAEIIAQTKDTSLEMQYSCAKCRAPLFTSKGIVPHDPNADHKQFQKNKHSYSGKGNACTSVFVDHEKVHWVQDEADRQKAKEAAERKKQQQDEEEGDDNSEWNNYSQYNSYGQAKINADDEKDLLCPNQKCKAKLGSKQWQGTQCSCGAWVTPAFKVLIAKVDAIPLQLLVQPQSAATTFQ